VRETEREHTSREGAEGEGADFQLSGEPDAAGPDPRTLGHDPSHPGTPVLSISLSFCAAFPENASVRSFGLMIHSSADFSILFSTLSS